MNKEAVIWDRDTIVTETVGTAADGGGCRLGTSTVAKKGYGKIPIISLLYISQTFLLSASRDASSGSYDLTFLMYTP